MFTLFRNQVILGAFSLVADSRLNLCFILVRLVYFLLVNHCYKLIHLIMIVKNCVFLEINIFYEIEFKIIMHVVIILVLAFHVCEDLYYLYRSFTTFSRVVDTIFLNWDVYSLPQILFFDPSQKRKEKNKGYCHNPPIVLLIFLIR